MKKESLDQLKQKLVNAELDYDLAKINIEDIQCQLQRAEKKQRILQKRREKEKAKKLRKAEFNRLHSGPQVTVRVDIYVRAKTKSEERRETSIESLDGTYILRRGNNMRITMYKNVLNQLEKLTYLSTPGFEKVLKSIRDDHFHTVYANISSQVEAIRLTEEGDSTPVEVNDDYEVNIPIAEDASLTTIAFPYININNTNDIFATQNTKYLFDPNSEWIKELKVSNVEYMKNSCLATYIIQTFRQTLLRLRKTNRIYLNYKTLWKMCRPNERYPVNGEYQLSLLQVVPFFKQYKLKFVAVDIFMNIQILYDPKTEWSEKTKRFCQRNKKVSPSTLRVLVHQHHAYPLNHDLDSFDQRVIRLAQEEANALRVSSKFFIRKKKKQKKTEVMLWTPSQIKEYIESYSMDAEKVTILTEYMLEPLLRHYRKGYGITGSYITTTKGFVTSFQIQQKKTIFEIKHPMRDDNQPDMAFKSEDEYDAYMKANDKIYKGLFNETNLSRYSPQFIAVMEQYTRGPISGMFHDDPSYTDRMGTSIDIIKAYTSLMLRMKKFPVGNEFCDFVKYDKESPIEDYHIYVVQSRGIVNTQDVILLDKKFVLMSGITLHEILEHKIPCEILYEWKPISVVPNPMIPKVKELWADESLSIDHKKSIMNINLGCLDKKRNQKNRAEFFEDKKEAHAKRKSNPDCQILAIHITPPTDAADEDYVNLDVGVDMSPKGVDVVTEDDLESTDADFEEDDFQELYLLINSHNKTLEEGFMPISFFKYDLHRLAMWKMYNRLEKADIIVKGMNTDSLFIAHGQEYKLDQYIKANPKDFSDSKGSFKDIGKWNKEEKFCRKKIIKQKQNNLEIDTTCHIPATKVHPEKEEEWETNPAYLQSVMNTFQQNDTYVLSKLPGSGKSTCSNEFIKDKNHLVAHPYNMQKEEMKKNTKLRAVTVSRLLGLGIDGKHRCTPVDVEGIEVIVFDEILALSSESQTKKIARHTRRFTTAFSS